MALSAPTPPSARTEAPPLLERLVGRERLQYARVVKLLVLRDLKIKYRGSFFGYLWSMVNPLLFMLLVTAVFGRLVSGIPNYGLYVLSGLLAWNMGSIAISLGTHSIVLNAHLLRKVRLPMWVFPLVPLGTSATNFVLSLGPFFLLWALSDVRAEASLLALPLVLGLYALFITGVSLTLSTLNVFFRDVGHVLEPLLQLTFYASPIIYARDVVAMPEVVRTLLGFNPFVHYIEGFRACLVQGRFPDPGAFAAMAGFAILSLTVGGVVYKKAKRKIIFNI
jgi:ABC-type polysaccharide/polyol phosphate export permease